MSKSKEKLQKNGKCPDEPTVMVERRTNCIYSIGSRIPARVVLYFLSWSGFLVSFMMRNDMNFAIVAMTEKHAIQTDNLTITNLGPHNQTDNITTTNLDNLREGEFSNWTSNVNSAILGSFYWCYVLSQVVGGIATQYFGTKNVFGWSQFATAVGSLLMPMAAEWHYGFVILLRSVQGFASGLTWPAMYAIVGFWIPPIERSRFMSSFQGFSIGIGLTYPLCGFIIAHFGWRLVFYTTGTIGMLWCVIWYFLAFNTPGEHPRISQNELEYIELNVSSEVKNGQGMKVPWKAIFSSLPAWSIGITTFGRIWVHYQFIMSGPTYMKYILKFNYQANGVLSGLPFLCSYVSAVFFCWATDVIVTKNILGLTNIRKINTAISQIVPGFLLLIIGYIDNIIIVLIIWFIAVTLITASYAGAMASIVDIAPNLAGPVLAFAQTIHMSASFLSPVITGLMVHDQKSIVEWQNVFILSFAVTIVTYIMFQIYGTSKIQPWNYPQRQVPPEESKMINGDTEGDEKT